MKSIALTVTAIVLLAVTSFAVPGDTIWTRTCGGSNNDIAYSIQLTGDGGYIIAGYTESFGAGDADFYLVKLDSEGDALWTRTYGGIYSDKAYSVQTSDDNGYIIAGYTESFGAGDEDFFLVKTNSDGDTLWTRTYGGQVFSYALSVQQTDNREYVSAGFTTSFGAGLADFYIVKVEGRVTDVHESDTTTLPVVFSLSQNSPNPFNATTTIPYDLKSAGDVTLEVYNLMGQKAATLIDGYMDAGKHTVNWDASSYASGIYFYKLSVNDQIFTKRMTLLK
jgi:hypothetical protein